MIYEDDVNGLTIYHHGVKGQKWGVRKAIKSYAKSALTYTKNQYRHPIASYSSNVKAITKHPVSYLIGGKKYLDAANKNTAHYNTKSAAHARKVAGKKTRVKIIKGGIKVAKAAAGIALGTLAADIAGGTRLGTTAKFETTLAAYGARAIKKAAVTRGMEFLTGAGHAGRHTATGTIINDIGLMRR